MSRSGPHQELYWPWQWTGLISLVIESVSLSHSFGSCVSTIKVSLGFLFGVVRKSRVQLQILLSQAFLGIQMTPFPQVSHHVPSMSVCLCVTGHWGDSNDLLLTSSSLRAPFLKQAISTCAGKLGPLHLLEGHNPPAVLSKWHFSWYPLTSLNIHWMNERPHWPWSDWIRKSKVHLPEVCRLHSTPSFHYLQWMPPVCIV